MFTIPPLTSDILTINLDAPGSPLINIDLDTPADGNRYQGWGFGWYPGDHHSSMIAKDPTARDTKIMMDAITDWANFRSTVFFCKIRAASDGYTHAETQPYSRSFAGRDWMFMHNGDLDKHELAKLHGKTQRLLEPMSHTDSELAFCNLLTKIQESGARRIVDLDPELLHSWFQRFDTLGSADMVLTDGSSVVYFHGTQSDKGLYYTRIQPPSNQDEYISDVARMVLHDPRDTYRTAFIVGSSPLTSGDSTAMHPGQMIIARRGAIMWNSVSDNLVEAIQTDTSAAVAAPDAGAAPSVPFMELTPPMSQSQAGSEQSQTAQQAERVLNARAMSHTPGGKPMQYRMFTVTHKSHYVYTSAVEHSTHAFRLQPTNDSVQEVISSKLFISSPAEEIQYEDVFGNQAIHAVIDEPYTELSVEASAIVKIYETPPDDHSLSRRQTSIPLAWMPWQRQMMMPYLLPTELPESQLIELTEYAMSFVERNDYKLLQTIEDINASIYRDYEYVSGSTSLHTTPFDVYTSRQGVCQDFANLLICMARLLSIPARYRMGYIYTGANYSNKIQSDASHAWAEVYLPFVGWRGFDPTNGCSAAQDHIRVACGRNYRDATPTAGTIYKGGGTETLTIDVKMIEINESDL